MSSRVDLRIFSCLSTLFYECIRQASVHLIIYTGENELSSLVPSFPHTHSLCFHRPLSALTGPSLPSQVPLYPHRSLSTFTRPSLPSHDPFCLHTPPLLSLQPLHRLRSPAFSFFLSLPSSVRSSYHYPLTSSQPLLYCFSLCLLSVLFAHYISVPTQPFRLFILPAHSLPSLPLSAPSQLFPSLFLIPLFERLYGSL